MRNGTAIALSAGVLLCAVGIPAWAAPRRIVRVTPRTRATVPPARTTPDVALIGVTELNNQSQAWLVDMRTGQRERVSPGGSAFGFRVSRIGPDTAVLTRAGQEFNLRMGDKQVPEVQPRTVVSAPAGVGTAPLPTARTRFRSQPNLLTPQGEVPLTPQDAGSIPPTAGSSGRTEVVPNPLPAGPFNNRGLNYPGYGYPTLGYDQYGNPTLGYPGYGGYDPDYYPYAYGGYPYDPTGYSPYGPMGPGLGSPYGGYPGLQTPTPPGVRTRSNPQTQRRSGADPSQGGYVNPQTRRRRGY